MKVEAMQLGLRHLDMGTPGGGDEKGAKVAKMLL